ncbi:DCDC5 protein, partial [Polypterus senegalus]
MKGGGPFYHTPDGLQLLPSIPPQTRPSVAEVLAVHPEALRVFPVFFPPAVPGVAEVLGSRFLQALGRRLAVATGPYRVGLPSPLPEATNKNKAVAPSWSGGGTSPRPIRSGVPVYENGQSTGGITVYLNRKEVERGCENNIKTMMDRMIHQRLQFCTDYSPSGLNLFPTCLFDQHGQKIQNPLSLQNDQEVWVAYGEDYRSPYNPVVNVAFDRVIAVHEEDKTCVYKMPPCDVDLPAAYDKYVKEFEVGRTVLWNLEDPQVVMYASVTVTSRSKGPSPKKKDNETQMFTSWSLTHIWIVTKAGVFLSRAMPQLCLAADDHSITLRTKDGASVEAYKLRIQKRIKGCPYQQWVFGKDGHIHSMANSEFVLTYLEELNVREEVTQTEEYNHQGAWSAEHQKTDSSFANKVSGSNVSDTNQTQVSRPIDTQPMPSGAPVESPQLTVALVRKLEDKHPKATAQRWAIKHEGTAKVGQWKFSKVENPLWNKLTYMWPVLPNGDLNELLSMCTTRLELSSAACRLYTADGTPAFRISELMAWAVNECFLASNTEEQEENQDSELAIQQEDDTASGRRISAMLPCRMIPTKSPVQPVVVEGGWMEPSQEEVKLMEDIQNIEVHLAEVQNVQGKKQIHFVQNISACEGDLYHLPSVKRVLVFVNGGNLKEGVFAWGKSIEELLDSCTIKLGMRKPAQILYTVEGKEISSMDEIERDMLICASSGEPFMTTKDDYRTLDGSTSTTLGIVTKQLEHFRVIIKGAASLQWMSLSRDEEDGAWEDRSKGIKGAERRKKRRD